MNKKDIKEAIVQALIMNEYQDNTNYDDIAVSVIEILEEKDYWNQKFQLINNNGIVKEQIHINNHTGDISL